MMMIMMIVVVVIVDDDDDDDDDDILQQLHTLVYPQLVHARLRILQGRHQLLLLMGLQCLTYYILHYRCLRNEDNYRVAIGEIDGQGQLVVVIVVHVVTPFITRVKLTLLQ